jgi:hypothetical protein
MLESQRTERALIAGWQKMAVATIARVPLAGFDSHKRLAVPYIGASRSSLARLGSSTVACARRSCAAAYSACNRASAFIVKEIVGDCRYCTSCERLAHWARVATRSSDANPAFGVSVLTAQERQRVAVLPIGYNEWRRVGALSIMTARSRRG